MSRAYVFAGMSLLLILPAVLLAGSFLSMIHTGDIATYLGLRGDVVSYAYKNIQNNFEIAACSYFLLTNDTAAIRGNLTQVWTPYVEANFSTGLGITVSIDESKINVTYDSATDSIKVGNVNNIDAAIPMNITVAGIRHDLGLKAVQIYRSCGRETTAAAETQTPSVTLFLHKQGTSYYMDANDPGCTGTNRVETISAGGSRVWEQSPAFNTSFNITGNIDVYLYLKPSTPYPTVTVKLYYGSSTLGSPVGYLVDNESWYVFTFTGVAGTVVPASTPLKLNVSVSGAGLVEVWYDYCDYNSGIVIPGSQTTGAADTTPPVIKNVLVKKITNSSATIVWTTDESSDSLVRYSNGTAAGYNSSNATFHSVTLTGLASSTTYSFQVESTDSSNNRATDNNGGAYYSFTTTSGSEVKEILWVDGAVSGPDKDAINANVSILRYFNDNQYVVVDGNEEDVVSFENASSIVSYVTSAMLYWADVRESGNPLRNLTLGNGSAWNWASYEANAPSSLTTYNLNVTSYFLGSSTDSVDLGNILLKYRNKDNSKKIDWDQAYLNVTYYTP